MSVRLKILTGKHAGKEVRLSKSLTVIGRSKQCDLRVSCEKVSRKHCEIVAEGDGAKLVDLGSANGTFINGDRVEGEQVFAPRDQLEVGTLTFEVILPEIEPEPMGVLEAADPDAGDENDTDFKVEDPPGKAKVEDSAVIDFLKEFALDGEGEEEEKEEQEGQEKKGADASEESHSVRETRPTSQQELQELRERLGRLRNKSSS
ncbi:MAG: FHA domain-containing protein [Planctomycetales bacterium]